MLNSQSDRDIAVFFDRCAQKGLMADFQPEERMKLDNFLNRWAIRPGDRVLEPGCGTGRLTAELAKAVGVEGEVWACDLSGEMLRLARERDLPAQVRFEQVSVLEIPCPDNWFDHIVCLNVFPHFLQPDRVLSEFARVVKLGGQLWIQHFEGREQLNHFHREAAPEVSRHALPCVWTMERMLTQVGFRIETLEDCADHYTLGAKLDLV